MLDISFCNLNNMVKLLLVSFFLKKIILVAYYTMT